MKVTVSLSDAVVDAAAKHLFPEAFEGHEEGRCGDCDRKRQLARYAAVEAAMIFEDARTTYSKRSYGAVTKRGILWDHTIRRSAADARAEAARDYGGSWERARLAGMKIVAIQLRSADEKER